MANLRTVQIPAEVKLQVANQAQVMRNLYKEFQDVFATVDPGSAFGKSLAKAFSKVESKLNASEGLLSGEFFSEADLRKVASQLSSISELFSEINIQARGVSAATLGLDTTSIEKAEQHLKSLLTKVKDLKGAKVGSLLAANDKDLQAFSKLSDKTGFSGGKSYAENYRAMEAALGRVGEEYGRVTEQAKQAQEAMDQASQAAAAARVDLNLAQGQLASRKQTNENVASQIMGIKVSGKGQNRETVTDQYLALLDSQLTADGSWVAGGENFAHIIAGWLEVDEGELAGTATEIVNNLRKAIQTAMKGGPIANNALRANAKSVLNGEVATLNKDAAYVEAAQKVDHATIDVQGAAIVAQEALDALTTANNTVAQTSQLLAEIQGQMARLRQLQEEYNKAVDDQYRNDIEAARTGVSTARSNVVRPVREATERNAAQGRAAAQRGQQTSSQWQFSRESADAARKAQEAQDKESEQFITNMKKSIAHWMSAQQIVNMVKQGIRQAWTDIQGLDKAMTNIAVVTDMSVGDLWGKINEYMSIAQQYGVTTQGVYEVSQLYYQQGLSTDEVMAATTETLKMARIAGMDYKEAADAMTVAIRAFKMEMEDAQRVTDVYSKVAAVTASDSEELAIAMSKTASSAESVGSSFENTTAMLAVMIETTRESAQNLGSALKSIISRYGEMKVGLTVDSEGEDIDYNKVDTALKSIGISIKDAQGQFRDFDDVIFELSAKWDSLDKNTQRYIATIMAGNRQQSRFIALVDNWERLDEVANAAQNSEDAGLLQYAKTLDSLETKINNIKTSFQEFYMSIMNGPFFGAILTFINNLLQGLNQFSTLGSIINIVGIVRGLKSGLTALTNLFSNSFGGIISGWQATQKRWLNLAIKSGRERGAAERRAYEQGYNTGSTGPTQTNVPGGGSTTSPYGKNYKQRRAEYRQMSWAERRQYGMQNGKVDWKRNSWGGSNVGQGIAVGGALIGTVANTVGAALSGAGHHEAGAVTSAIGNVASFASMGAAAGPWGALIGAVVGLAVSVPDLVKAFDTNNQLQREYEKAQKDAQEAEVKKAEEVNKYNTLKDLLQQYDKAKSQRGNSDEDYNNWININSKLAEMYPQLISYIDAEGNAIVDVTDATKVLESAMGKASKASELYYEAKENEYKAQMAMNANYEYSDRRWNEPASHETYQRLGFRVDNPNARNGRATIYTPDGTQVGTSGAWVEFTSETLVDTATQLGVNLDNVLLAAQGVDVELTELESEWLNFFTSADGLNKKVFTQKDGVITGWHENIGNYIAGNTGLQQLNSTQQKDLADAVYWKTEASSSDDNLTQMDGANALIASYILSTQENVQTAQDIRNLTVEQYNDAIASLVDEYEALNLKSREFINDLYNNLDGMSLMDLENAFSEYDIGGNLANTFRSTWYEQNYNRVTRYGNALFQKNAEGNPLEGFEDYSVWSAKEENKGKTKQQYYEAAIAHYRSLGDQIDQSLLDFVINSSDAAVEGYISALERENNIIAGGGMASRAAAGRLGYISQVVQASAEDGTYGELTKAQTDEFIALLGADDAGTQEWAERVREFAKKYNVVIPELESFIYENFTTRMQSLLDGIDDFKKETEDFFAKAEEGFTFDEALKFLKDLDLSEEEFGNIFEIKDGKILLKDFNSAFGMLYDKQFENLASITSSVNTMVTEIGKDSYEFMDSMRIDHKAEIDNIDSLEERAAMKTDLASDLVRMLGIDTGLADEAADWLIDNVNATDAEFIEWLKSKGVVAEQATEYLEQARTRQLASFSFDNWFKDSYGDKNTLKGLTENPTLEAIKDYAIDNNLVTGVDTDADGLIDSYNWDTYFSTLQGVAIDAFGNMTITDAEAFYLSVTGKTKDMLTAVDWELINLLGSQIDASNEAAIEAFGSIGASAAKGKADYTKVFAKTIAQAGWTEDQFDKEMKKRLSSAASGDATSYGYVKSIIKGEWDKQGRVYTDDELIDATDAFINGYADGQTENAKRFLELSQKQLEGTITQAELKELSEIEIDDQWASDLADVLATEGLSTVQKYGAIVEAAIKSGLPWSEIEQTIKEGYSKQLEGLLNEELGFNDAGDTLFAISGMEEAAGHYTNDVLSSIFNQASAETGKAVDLTLFRDYFTFDQETKTWVVKAGKNVNDFLQETYGEDVPEWLIGAFDASESQKAINKAIKMDSTATSVTDTISKIFGSATEVSLEQMASLYEDIHGKGTFKDSGKLAEYQAAVEAAQNGNIGALINLLYELANDAIAAGYDVDTSALKAAQKDAHNALVSGLVTSLTAGLDGTLSNADFDKLIEQIGGAPEAYRQYVTETYDGLKISAEGVLAITNELIAKFGNSDAIVHGLVDQFKGGDFLGSYIDIDRLIKQIESDTENWTEETQATLDILYKMRNVYSQMADDEVFDIMGYDPFDGAADNYYKYQQSVTEVAETLDGVFKTGEKMSEQDFHSMMGWFKNFIPNGFNAKIGETNVTLGQFADAVQKTAKAGKVDISAAAQSLGITMDDISSTMDVGLKDFANKQVAYWESYLKFLEGIKELDKVSDDLKITPPKLEFDDEGNLTAEARAAYEAYLKTIYDAFNNSGVEQYMGVNNPLNQLWQHLGWGDTFDFATVPKGMEAQALQYVSNLANWFTQNFDESNITDVIGKDNQVDIPFESFINITPSSTTTTETSGTPAAGTAPIQDAVQKTIESWGFKPDGAGGYVYELNGITMKIALGADGTPVGLDLTNASGTPPTAAEMAAVFGDNPNFIPGTDGNWTFKDTTTGIVYKCSNGQVTIDSSGFTAPSTTPASEIETILSNATGWTATTEGGVTKYSTTVNGWKFEYTAGAEDIKVTKPGALAPESFTIADLLNGSLWTAVTTGTTTGTTYTQDSGWQFEYSATTKSITVKSPSGVIEEIDTSAPDFQNGWSGDGTIYTKELNGYTFTYNKSTSTLTVSPPSAPADPDLSTILTEANGWTPGATVGSYTKTLDGTTLNYNAITGEFSVVSPEGGPTTNDNIAEIVTKFFGAGATYSEGVITLGNGVKINMNASKGSLLGALQTGAAQGYSLSEIATAFFGPGVTCEGNVITLPGGTTIDLDATIGEILATSDEEGATTGLSTEDLVKKIFGEGAVYDSATGTVTMPNGVKIDLNATLKELSFKNPNTTDGSYSIVLAPDTNLIDTALAGYNNQPIKISLELTNSKNSLLNSPAYNDLVAKTRAYLDGNLSMGDMQTAYYQAYQAFSPYIPSMSREDLLALQQLQESIDFGLFSNEGIEEGTWWTALGEEVSAALAALPEEEEIAGITSLFNSLSNEGLTANLLGLTSLFSALVSPELATLDLTNFIAQIESMGEIELDDEEINLVATAAQALADALLPLKDASINPTVSVDTTTAYNRLENLKRLYDAIKSKTVTVSVNTQYNGGDGGGGGTEENPGGEPADYAGNVSGLAFAKGNATKKLLAGAHLAGKTLVGELGPELAVYDNQYHLLGRNGAEFVDLPKDAIVFNHRQTAGIVKGQAGYRGKALVNGNVEGPAAASGIDAAIETVKGIIQLWKNVADSSLSDMLDAGGGGGGGGSGNTIKAVTEELQEWYNLSRQIEHIEQEINNLIAERSNLLESDGAAYLRSLREEQALLRDQVATQETLLQYQQLQLQRQADHITDPNSIWSKFLKIDENGLLQYKNGNEMGDGKGALEVLQNLNKMSGQDQIDYITGTLGYSYTNADGEELEGEDLVKQFFQEFQDQIDSYDSLYDTVHQTEEKLQQLATNIEKINQEIKENQMELEQDIFDILVEAWEAEIETLEEQKDLIEEANEAYIDSLQEALQTERDMYSDNERLADREQLQRQLSLLRRSGGSASEIASLEEQLDSMLKEEYFSKQEEMIQNISDANDEQIRLLDEQIRLEEESLEYQKENGILWSRVYDIMSGSSESILAFMQGNKTEFFAQSALQQEQMLTEWAKKVGIYTENRQYEQYEAKAKEEVWDTGAIWQQDGMGDLKSTYEGLSNEEQNTVRDHFTSAYASARIAGKSHEEALAAATDAVKDTLENEANVNEAANENTPPTNDPGAAAEFMYVQGSGKLNLREQANKKSKSLGTYSPGTKVKILKKENEDWYKVEVNGATGYMMAKYLTSKKPGSDDEEESNGETKYRRQATVTYVKADGTTGTVTGKGVDASKWTAEQIALRYAKGKIPAGGTYQSVKYSSYSKGGLVDYTGLALVHGKPGQPEAFLNAKQTALISEAVKSVGDGGALDGIKATLTALNNTIKSITNNNNIQSSSFTVAPGAVTIQVAQLNDSYDVEELSKDVMNRMVAIASKSTNRGVNRR